MLLSLPSCIEESGLQRTVSRAIVIFATSEENERNYEKSVYLPEANFMSFEDFSFILRLCPSNFLISFFFLKSWIIYDRPGFASFIGLISSRQLCVSSPKYSSFPCPWNPEVQKLLWWSKISWTMKRTQISLLIHQLTVSSQSFLIQCVPEEQ